MANPNIATAQNIYGTTATYVGVPTNLTLIGGSSTPANRVRRINTIMAVNKNGTSSYDITVAYYTGSYIYLASTISVPADSTLVIVSKDTAIYLMEGHAIYAMASSAGTIDIIMSYEEIYA